MLNTVLFRDVFHNDVLGAVNFLAEKLFYVKNHRKIDRIGRILPCYTDVRLPFAFNWPAHGSDRFWRNVSSSRGRVLEVVPDYWVDYA